jgi:Cd2+/Zn2+-exporting ATPase
MREKRGMARGLAALGLTEYEAKVYMALLADSPASGYQIGKRAGVPRSMVYEALGRLESRGMVLKTGEARATLYRPLPPDLLLRRYEAEQQSLVAELRQTMEALYQAPVEDRLWMVTGRAAYLSYAGQMIDDADGELLLLMNDADLEVLRPSIDAAAVRGLSISAVLTGNGELAGARTVHHPPRESDAQELTHTLVIVAGRREALVASSREPAAATVTNNSAWVSIARQFLWMELFAQKVVARLGPELIDRLDAEASSPLDGLLQPLDNRGQR